jgi:hypothetical protein
MSQHPSNKITLENVNEIFMYHADEWKIRHYQEIRQHAKYLAKAILKNTPDCADRAASLRKLRECVMTANAAVALAEEPWYEVPAS